MASTQKTKRTSSTAATSPSNGAAAGQRAEIIADYRLAYKSRQSSYLGRREVLTGKAKFGIFGDGKELANIAMAKVFRHGDFRAGYYRDQTFMMALGLLSVQEHFAQLYAHTDVVADPASAGRSMGGHFSTRLLNDDGSWKNLSEQYNSSADISPTSGQMPRLVGLAYASRLYRELDELKQFTQFSHNGDEIAFGTIGNASCAEGPFWEAVNAIGVLRAPAIISIWDDGYGISVPNELEVTKSNVGELLRGFQREPGTNDGYEIFVARGWNYPELLDTFRKAEAITRTEHVPCIIHVIEVTQPQGHSTSGSHERYKSAERLQWEKDFDPVTRMRAWIIAQGYATDAELAAWEAEETADVKAQKDRAWAAYCAPIQASITEVCAMLEEIAPRSSAPDVIAGIRGQLMMARDPSHMDIAVEVAKALFTLRDDPAELRAPLIAWRKAQEALQYDRYASSLYSEAMDSALFVPEVKPAYTESSPVLQGFEVLNACFDAALGRDPRVIAFGEDVGHLGDVNQGFIGMQAKYGPLRVSDTGIRETTIIGQAIGMSLRGLRPIAEIQYLDYVPYAMQVLTDDLSTLRYRTKGGQKSPVIVRTRGHRLEGIWHSGSPMSGILNLVRGVYVCVPRNMTQAAGFYNTLLRAEEPAIIVEVLNGYRFKETRPDNIGEFTVPLGVPEILRGGNDVTVVTYGACCRIVLEAAERLEKVGIDIEVIDVQTLIPFDRPQMIAASLKKTGRVLFVDEDVPGGASAYMMQHVLEREDAYTLLDAPPQTLTGTDHRPAYGSDGNYWSKPNVETVFETVYRMMHESNPLQWKLFF